ncbi:MAG: hypothetical protein Q7O04_00825 [Candidatus Omnitrophota bacterium]|nr:hypothetical protein [Candidatus Omnitrophota bacterium]
MNCKYCADDLNFKIKVVDIQRGCKYHKKKGELYSASAIAPEGLCREIFYEAYPSCLALLYNGVPVNMRPRKKGTEEMIVVCPAPEGVKVRIRSEEILPPFLRILKEFMEEVLKKVYRAFDIPLRNVIIEVMEAGPACPKGYKTGDRFKFNISRRDELCPAGFALVYPYVRSLPGIKNKNQGSFCVHCPDYVGVTYEIISG